MDQCNCKICKIEISKLKAQIMNLVTTKTKKKPTCDVTNNKKPKRMTLNQLVGVVETIAINLSQLTTTMNNRFDAIEKRIAYLEQNVVMKDDLKKIFKPSAFKSTTH